MLSYHPAMHEMLGRPSDRSELGAVLGESVHGNKNYFAYLTSGFHSVNDSFLSGQVDALVGQDESFDSLGQPYSRCHIRSYVFTHYCRANHN